MTFAEESALVSWFGIGVEHPSRKGIARSQRARVARYGPGVRYTHYVSGEVELEMPPELGELADRLVARGLVPADERPNSITVNEYAIGSQLTYHTDVPRAGRIISTLTLLGDATLSMLRPAISEAPQLRVDLPFRRRMLVQFTGACRAAPWLHAILPVKEHRLSVVFRHGTPTRTALPGTPQTG